MKTIVQTAGADEFFKRGQEIARFADQGKRIARERVIAFEDPEELARLVTAAKLSEARVAARRVLLAM
jgi:predicted transcriptional regulator